MVILTKLYAHKWRIFVGVHFLIFIVSITSINIGIHENKGFAELDIPHSRNTSASSIKKIVFWNGWYHRMNYGFGYGRKPFLDNKCSETRCATFGRPDNGSIDDADAVIIHRRTFSNHSVYLRRSDRTQVFVFFDTEPPILQDNYDILHDLFNITITYRRDSTIPFPYSRTVRKSNKSGSSSNVKFKSKHKSVSAEYDDYVHKPLTLEDLRNKSRSHVVSWMVSKCRRQTTMRIGYAHELQTHMPVDIYGDCGNLTCPKTPENTSCMVHMERNYKFYLAFENSNCKDYVTEKAFRTLGYNLVPVVMGGANYKQLLPPHSFIDVRDFPSPAALAARLEHLNQHDDEYLSYFAWKDEYEIVDVGVAEPFCQLCEMLHQHDQQQEFLSGFDVGAWWANDSGGRCREYDKNTQARQLGMKPPLD